MSKKVRIMIAVLVATLLLAVGGTAAVMAAGPAGEGPGDEDLLSRVANILGIDEDELSEAFQQSRQEMREECAASGNGTCEQWMNRFSEQRQEQYQEWNGPRHGGGHGFCGGEDAGNQFGTSQATRGRQMTAVGSGQGTMAAGFAGQGLLR